MNVINLVMPRQSSNKLHSNVQLILLSAISWDLTALFVFARAYAIQHHPHALSHTYMAHDTLVVVTSSNEKDSCFISISLQTQSIDRFIKPAHVVAHSSASPLNPLVSNSGAVKGVVNSLQIFIFDFQVTNRKVIYKNKPFSLMLETYTERLDNTIFNVI